jgi:hypothetical protein
MGRTCSTHGEIRNLDKILEVSREETICETRRWWVGDIKTCVTDMGVIFWSGFNWLRIGYNGEILGTR